MKGVGKGTASGQVMVKEGRVFVDAPVGLDRTRQSKGKLRL